MVTAQLRFIILLIIALTFVACGKNEIDRKLLPISYSSYDDNYFERLLWYIQGVDTINYGGSFQLNKDNTFNYNGCVCQSNGVWEQRNDSLFFYHASFGIDSSKGIYDIDCTRLDSIFIIRKNGDWLEVAEREKGHLKLFSAEE